MKKFKVIKTRDPYSPRRARALCQRWGEAGDFTHRLLRKFVPTAYALLKGGGHISVVILMVVMMLGSFLRVAAAEHNPVNIRHLRYSGTHTPTTATPNVTATSAVVIDFETGEVLFGRNETLLRPPASMSKNITAYIIYEEIAAGRLTLDTMITVGQNAVNISRQDWHQATVFRNVGAEHSVETMLKLIMLPSHNGACVAMAEHISGSEAAFVERMNETLRRMGIEAHFDNPHGLWGNSISALGMAQFVRNFITEFPDILRITSTRNFIFGGQNVQNTNNLLARAHVDGFKTGTTAAAGFCLSSTAFRGDYRAVAVVMNSSSRYTRFSDSERLLNFGLDEAARKAAERVAIEAARRAYVSINGTLVEFEDVGARLINNRVLAPIRPIAIELGGTVSWDGQTQTVTIHSADGDIITLTIGVNTMFINGQAYEIDVAPSIYNGRAILPVRFIVVAMGADVVWDYSSRTSMITTG